jgi:hypothetical protein
MEPIPFHTPQSFNFLFPSNYGISNGMELYIFNITLFYSPFYFPLPLHKTLYLTSYTANFSLPNKVYHFLFIIVCPKNKNNICLCSFTAREVGVCLCVQSLVFYCKKACCFNLATIKQKQKKMTTIMTPESLIFMYYECFLIIFYLIYVAMDFCF